MCSCIFVCFDRMDERDGYFDGWKLTEAQKRLINRRDGSAESKAAFERFFFENYGRLFALAKAVLYKVFRIEVRSYAKTFAIYGQKEIAAGEYNRFAKNVICARRAVTQNEVVEASDLLNSLYADYLSGHIVLRMEEGYIGGMICHSYRYAAVGGLDGVDEYKRKSTERKCQNQPNYTISDAGT